MDTISILVLTMNEEKNIRKLIDSVIPLTERIYVVDSGSEDRTVDICQEYGVAVIAHDFTTQSDQFNWALENINFNTDWIMRMDADEELTKSLVTELKEFLKSPPENISGVYVRRRVYFMGRWIKHGGYYPTWLLRVFRRGVGRCESLWMDEHIVLDRGETINMKEDIIDKNNKDLTFWTDKHNKYASREVLDILEQRRQGGDGMMASDLTQGQASSRRWAKNNIYSRAPLFVRPLLYFLYRYFIRLGLLDGKEGLIFHFLQGFWYRFLVDAKLFEHYRQESIEAQADER